MKLLLFAAFIVLAFAALDEDGDFQTYEHVKEQLFFIGNDMRNDPEGVGEEAGVDSDTYKWLEDQPENGNLEWSTGLQRACRDLILDNGPYGVEGHTAAFTGDANARASKYLSSFSNLHEAIVYDPIEYSSDDDTKANRREALEEYKGMMGLDEDERAGLFDPDVTHVGIQCGCHATKEEFCCFMYATDAVTKEGTKPMNVMVVDQDSCEDSTGWSDKLVGEEYVDDDSGAEKDTGEPDSYGDLAQEIFQSYARLCEDPDKWAADQKDPWAIKISKQFKSHKIKFSQDLTEIALAFENESAPCNYDINKSGDSLKSFFEHHVDRYKKALLVSYEGEYDTDPNIVLIDLLKRGVIDQDAFDGHYDELGVACACNSVTGMECLLIFGDRAKIKGSSRFMTEPTDVADRAECEKRCHLDIFVE